MTLEYGFCFRPVCGRGDCSGPLHLWIGNRVAICLIPTAYDVSHEEWDAVGGRLLLSESDDHRRQLLSRYAESMERDLRLVERTIRELESSCRSVTVAAVVDACGRKMQATESSLVS